MLIKALKDFARNTDPFDPVGKRPSDLLSFKEKIKGLYLPHGAMLALAAASGALLIMTSGIGWFLITCTVMPTLVLARHALSITLLKRLLAGEKAFNINTPEGRQQFAARCPDHKNLPRILLNICREAGLKEIPTVYIDTAVLGKNGIAAVCSLSLFGKPQNALLIHPSLLDKKRDNAFEERKLAGVLAHEIGHVKLKHTSIAKQSSSIVALVMAAFAIPSGVASIVYIYASYNFIKIAKAKVQQYRERQCDRFSFQYTGTGKSMGLFFSRQPRNRLTTSFRLFAAHPHVTQRAAYCRDMEEAQPEYARTKRAEIGIR